MNIIIPAAMRNFLSDRNLNVNNLIDNLKEKNVELSIEKYLNKINSLLYSPSKIGTKSNIKYILNEIWSYVCEQLQIDSSAVEFDTDDEKKYLVDKTAAIFYLSIVFIIFDDNVVRHGGLESVGGYIKNYLSTIKRMILDSTKGEQ